MDDFHHEDPAVKALWGLLGLRPIHEVMKAIQGDPKFAHLSIQCASLSCEKGGFVYHILLVLVRGKFKPIEMKKKSQIQHLGK